MNLTSRDGGHRLVGDSAVPTLRRQLKGQLITPTHADYASARRVWNGNVDRRPGLIVRCTCAADVR